MRSILITLAALAIVGGCRRDKNRIIDTQVVEPTMVLDQPKGADTSAPAIGAVDVSELGSDTATYSVSYTLSKLPRLGDTVQIRLIRDSLSPVVTRLVASTKRTDQAATVLLKMVKTFGATARYAACARIVARTVTVPGERCSAKWSTNLPAKPDTLPPTVDTVRVDTASLTLSHNLVKGVYTSFRRDTVQFCTYHQMADGKYRMNAGQVQYWRCRQLYDSFPASQRLPGYPVAYTKDPTTVNVKIEPLQP